MVKALPTYKAPTIDQDHGKSTLCFNHIVLYPHNNMQLLHCYVEN